MLEYVAIRGSVLSPVEVRISGALKDYSAVQCSAVQCSALQHDAVCCSVWQCTFTPAEVRIAAALGDTAGEIVL